VSHAQIAVVDENDQPVGVFPKEEVWAKGLLHRIVRIMVEDDKGRVLLQRRSPHMDTYPNTWDHSAAGHVDEGEDYSEAARRELAEELGIKDVMLEEIDYYQTRDVFQKRIMNRFNKLYKAYLNNPSLKLQKSEVSDTQWFTVKDVQKLIADHPDQVAEGLRQVMRDYYGKS
jgi:isopentenyldiphosphate isomerase